MLLTKEDVEAVNRLLSWRADCVAAGHKASAELRQNANGEFIATLTTDGRKPDDALDLYEFAYGASIPTAVDAVLNKADLAGGIPARDTEPAPPMPAEAVTALEELMS